MDLRWWRTCAVWRTLWQAAALVLHLNLVLLLVGTDKKIEKVLEQLTLNAMRGLSPNIGIFSPIANVTVCRKHFIHLVTD